MQIKSNKIIKRKKIDYRKNRKICKCGALINKFSQTCNKCRGNQQKKVNRPSYEQLMKEINEGSYCSVGRKYGVSDNAVRKWVKDYEK